LACIFVLLLKEEHKILCDDENRKINMRKETSKEKMLVFFKTSPLSGHFYLLDAGSSGGVVGLHVQTGGVDICNAHSNVVVTVSIGSEDTVFSERYCLSRFCFEMTRQLT
jgi:hypothetical protein